MANTAALPTVRAGDRVEAISTTGPLTRIATTGVVAGHRFPIVWISTEEEWNLARQEQREPDAVPWPAEDVRPAG